MSYTPPPGAPPHGYVPPAAPPGGYGPPGMPPGGYGPPGMPPGGYGPPGGPPAPKKSGCSQGCLIAAGIMGVLFLIGVGILAYAGYQVSQDPQMKKAFEVAGDALELMKDAQEADGMAELRDEGCDQAMLFDVDKLLDFAEKHAETDDFERPAVSVDEVIICYTDKTDQSCGDVAKAYVDAADPDHDFLVIVNHTRKGAQCSELFDEDGDSKGEFEGEVPVPDLPQ